MNPKAMYTGLLHAQQLVMLPPERPRVTRQRYRDHRGRRMLINLKRNRSGNRHGPQRSLRCLLPRPRFHCSNSHLGPINKEGSNMTTEEKVNGGTTRVINSKAALINKGKGSNSKEQETIKAEER